jgi:hypothetical protein
MFDKTAKEKTKDLLEKGENVFMWTPNMKYKDFNDLAVKEKLDEVDYNTILDSIF